MSEHSDFIVDMEATLEEAPELAQRVVDWLIEHGVIEPRPRLDASGRLQAQYAPGPRAQEAAEYVALDLHRCGLTVHLERRVFDAGGNGLEALGCPRCGHAHPRDGIDWSDAVGRWYEGLEDDGLRCPACGGNATVTEWIFEPGTPFCWGFGHLGFEFQAFSLRASVVEEISRLLGHRVRLVHRRI